MTLKEHLFNLADEKLAELFVKENEYQGSNDYSDYNDYETTDGKSFEIYIEIEAVDH